MRVPFRWLSEFVDTGLTPRELAHRLTMAGLEAEKIEEIGAGWDKVFVGHVDRVERHPGADRLVLATVRAGEHCLTVVTGAPNIAAGQKVALALAGARLFDGHSETPTLKTLKPGTIRGVRSEGMVCSEKELGLSDEHEGIMVLEAEAPGGVPLADWLGDTVIEFEITPNLVHAFSILGIAREAAALTDQPLHPPDAPNLTAAPAGPANLVEIEAPDLCPRYSATVIDGITVGPSPEWMRRRLELAGVRSINNVVDVTNYVMLEWGQPLHAFDIDNLAEGRIVVRRARPGETIQSLDHQQRQLTPDMLVIADAERPVAIAGLMGGVASEVTDETTTILLEAANFDMKSVRATGRALKLRTDASVRFERGLDRNLVPDAAGRATRLLLDICPGSQVVAVKDVYPRLLLPHDLTMSFAEFERLLGMRLSESDVLGALARLGFAPHLADDILTVTVPTWRPDVTLPADVVEEAARVIGYDMLPATLPSGETAPVRRDPLHLLAQGVRRTLVGCGAFETVNYVAVGEAQVRPFTDAANQQGFLHRIDGAAAIRLRNPLHGDRPLLRTTLIPSLLEIAASNLKHETGVRLFEIARAYLPSGDVLPDERMVVGIVIAGQREPVGRFAEPGALDFFDLKGTVEAVLTRAGVEPRFVPTTHPALHPGRAAVVLVGDSEVALLGELRPDVAAAFGIEADRVPVAEIDLDTLLELAEPVSGVRVARFLPAEQDFAIVVAEEIPASDVETALRAGAGPLASGVALFDIYRGPQIPQGRKSLAYRVTFTAPDRALTDAELERVRDRIAKVLKQRVGGELRI
ncbi:MAG: phenylalanine--tRNA ligase subunit beta [Thermomicrobiales bacterium]|nr:phenylalanine--tRNA ligase subunit beta [Thermomicrobiales bacterium]